jgi:hypothetical protein
MFNPFANLIIQMAQLAMQAIMGTRLKDLGYKQGVQPYSEGVFVKAFYLRKVRYDLHEGLLLIRKHRHVQ